MNVIHRPTLLLSLVAFVLLATVLPLASLSAQDHGSDALENRLRGLEARVSQLEHQVAALTASGVAQQPAGTDVETADAAARLRGLPASTPEVVAKRLAELFPEGRVIEHGSDAGDGYYWFEIRVNGQLRDVEITEDGVVRKNRRTFD
ncbi:hypothetical protein [Mucisphaera sp.]|uniref:hypothetical protein n=1 Tax=Mucisphaera sp. TaxID=2913024 RepID=UPI003D09CCAC